MGMMLVGMLLVATAFATSDGDTKSARHDQYYKEAYNAADAGINWYFYHLTQDANYWSQCANMGKPVWAKNASTMTFQSIPSSEAQYEIEILPAPGQTACTAGVSTSVVDPSSGAFKVRSTGNYRGVHRTIVATFRRVGFLNFLYFTDFETLDPVTAGDANAQAQASAACSHYYYQSARDQNICADPAFIGADTIDGPMHSNDQLLICGHPNFGHQATDHVEDSDPNSPGYRVASGCGTSSPTTPGNNFKYKAPILTLPPSNASLKDDADPSYVFTGTTHIVLNGANMTVNGVNKALPTNGVVYVQNQNCTPQYDSTMDYPQVTDGTGCGDIYVRGNVTKDLTIGADNDIIIDGNVTHGSGVELGLIANNFVRIYHPIDRSQNCTVNGSGNPDANATTSPEDPNRGAMNDPVIDAAILAINHSFIVDNWACGAGPGDLTVSGAIAQKYRGTVGTHSGSTIVTGYAKAYSYDYELRYHQPPYFLDPVQAGWGILQETEQSPAAH
jgi:hypothetical protein